MACRVRPLTPAELEAFANVWWLERPVAEPTPAAPTPLGMGPFDEAIEGLRIDAGIAGRVALVWSRAGEGRERGNLRLLQVDDFSLLPASPWRALEHFTTLSHDTSIGAFRHFVADHSLLAMEAA
jgi:hypothetical protein